MTHIVRFNAVVAVKNLRKVLRTDAHAFILTLIVTSPWETLQLSVTLVPLGEYLIALNMLQLVDSLNKLPGQQAQLFQSKKLQTPPMHN